MATTTTQLVGTTPESISAFGQWLALSRRGIVHIVKNGEFVFAIVSPLFLAICFYLPLRKVMALQGIDYAQFLMPIIVLQSVGFAASSAAMRSAIDGDKGINTRFRVLPMNPAIPPLARLATNTTLLCVSVIFATIICLIIGWRPHGGVAGLAALYGLSLLIGVAGSLLADGLGMAAGSPEATSQATALPLLILGMCSTGFATAQSFPTWLQPFARNQPISQWANALRAVDAGDFSWYSIGPALWWCVGLSVVAAIALGFGVRKAGR
ncbi:ABC transporter permease [Gordonia asplenii]|uniref:ABC transporter permease n=1 Tax=Gordonia asplenii TaxID=2725283 RepID=UPI0028AE2557|nr:ABC transporter permease [Gordonia asplenii]